MGDVTVNMIGIAAKQPAVAIGREGFSIEAVERSSRANFELEI